MEMHGLNSMILNVVFLPSPSLHPVFRFFKQSIAKSLTPINRFLNSRSRRSRGDRFMVHASAYLGEGVLERKRTIWSVSKSGSVLHASTSSNVAKRGLFTGSNRIPRSLAGMSCG